MSLDPGSFLHNRYEIEGRLGKGGMGAVYLAQDKTLGIRVAVKENLNLNPESERQFRREAGLLASLRHPNLPRVTDHFILEDRQYLVMDYIEGVDLHTRALQQPPTIPEVLEWADSIADALVYLHSRNPPVIHRDIKPANIKLQPDGTAVLVDFGIAKIFDQEQTTTGARGMTPGFSPPEQYGSGRTDHRSDQYALAATVYALLTGSAPADSIERMMDNEEYQPPSTHKQDIPEHVDASLNKALSISQDARFPSMASFRAGLKGQIPAPTIRSDSLVPTMREAPLSRQRSWTLPVLLGTGAVGLLFLGVGAFFLFTRGLPGLSGLSSSPTDPPGPTATLEVVLPPTEALPTDSPSPTLEPSPTPTVPLEPTNVPITRGGGGRIAFVSDREDGQTLQIWTMNPDGTSPRQLTFGPGDKTQPRWSPDGSRLAFVAGGGTDEFNNDFGLDIWSISADGTDLKNMTRAVGDDTEPAWSPDGDQIAFTSDRVNDLRLIFVMGTGCLEEAGEDSCWNLSPTRISCTTDFCAVEYSPSWSPDGSTIAVAASINTAPGRIFLRGPSGGDPLQFDRSDTIIGASELDWSPDGNLLVFTWQIQRGRTEIYQVSINDPRAEPVQLTNTLGNKEPAFSSDGQWIAFTSTRDQNPEIYVMSSNGANEENLTNDPGSRDLQPDWQPPPSP